MHLVYVNVTRKNVVMVQYKMLEPDSTEGDLREWLYRPDKNLADELKRMQQFRKSLPPQAGEYRLNPEVFYIKFVKRDAVGESAAITMPLEHFEMVYHSIG